MSSPQLTPVSYVVLGLVAQGATTSYDMKQKASRSVGYFWNFPHSQLYAEPAHLVELGLLDEEREAEGRRRRVYSLTPAGRTALADWLREPTSEQPQIRDTGLLKLFFGDGMSADEIAALAARRLRDDRGLRHEPQPRRGRARRAPARADVHRILARGGGYSTVTVF